MTQIEIFYGSLAASAGSVFKSLQIVNIPDLDQMKKDVNDFISQPDIEVISINQQFNDGVLSVLVHFKKK